MNVSENTVVSEAAENFFIFDASAFTQRIAEFSENSSFALRTIAAAFEQNIASVAQTAGIPFALATAAVHGSHWQRVYSAARIRSLKLDASPSEDKDALEARRSAQASQQASIQMKAFLESRDGPEIIAKQTCEFMLDALHSGELEVAAEELIRQGLVLTWGALETLSRDLFEAILNSEPYLALQILREPTAKNRLPSKFSVEELAIFGFDLSNSLGSILATQQDFSDIKTIKAVINPTLSRKTVPINELEDPDLWCLCQQRHLIVHRRGVIDSRYIESTRESCRVGDRLKISPERLQAYLEVVVNAGTAMLQAALELMAKK